ncbi:MAG: hypothetical protein NUW37_12225 [Planctomycetes bacterium]|nr:hypothetical protein [Planctomycetota bacterium]
MLDGIPDARIEKARKTIRDRLEKVKRPRKTCLWVAGIHAVLYFIYLIGTIIDRDGASKAVQFGLAIPMLAFFVGGVVYDLEMRTLKLLLSLLEDEPENLKQLDELHLKTK